MTRGFFIFLVFIWKKPIWKALIDTHPKIGLALSAYCSCLSSNCSVSWSRQNSTNNHTQRSPLTYSPSVRKALLSDNHTNAAHHQQGHGETAGSSGPKKPLLNDAPAEGAAVSAAAAAPAHNRKISFKAARSQGSTGFQLEEHIEEDAVSSF